MSGNVLLLQRKYYICVVAVMRLGASALPDASSISFYHTQTQCVCNKVWAFLRQLPIHKKHHIVTSGSIRCRGRGGKILQQGKGGGEAEGEKKLAYNSRRVIDFSIFRLRPRRFWEYGGGGGWGKRGSRELREKGEIREGRKREGYMRKG